jgi:XRE family transcriptional regulator, regulator of sulfur utilization
MATESAERDASLREVSARIARAVRRHRTASALSLGGLAREAGLSKTILSRIEAGEGNPSVETLWRLATALRVPLSALLADDDAPTVRVIRARSTDPLHADSGMDAWLVHSEAREHRSELFELDLGAGVEQRSDHHLPGTQELVVCTAGRLRVGPLEREAELGPGDALWFAADLAHRYVALEPARALCWILYPRAT